MQSILNNKSGKMEPVGSVIKTGNDTPEQMHREAKPLSRDFSGAAQHKGRLTLAANTCVVINLIFAWRA